MEVESDPTGVVAVVAGGAAVVTAVVAAVVAVGGGEGSKPSMMRPSPDLEYINACNNTHAKNTMRMPHRIE